MPSRRGEPVEILEGQEFSSLEEAEWTVFKRRWAVQTGRGRCQTKTSCFAQSHNRQISGRKLTLLHQGGGTIEFEVFAIVKMAFLIEMIVD